MVLTLYVFTFCLLLLQNKIFCGMLKVSRIVSVVWFVVCFFFPSVLYFKHKINTVLDAQVLEQLHQKSIMSRFYCLFLLREGVTTVTDWQACKIIASSLTYELKACIKSTSKWYSLLQTWTSFSYFFISCD